MAAEPKKPKFPSKTCPKCGKLIHARSHSHPACGWVMSSNGQAAPAAPKQAAKAKKLGRPKGATKASSTGGISIDDIRAVRDLAEKIGAEKVKQLAQVLAK